MRLLDGTSRYLSGATTNCRFIDANLYKMAKLCVRPHTGSLRRDLATALTVEYTPQSEILSKVLVMMLGARCDEQEIA